MIFIALFTILASTTCKKEKPGEYPPGAAKLRVENGTPFKIDSCYINPGTWNSGHNYGQIDINALTDYHAFDSVYYYGYVKVKMNSKIYQLIPIDYVGETPFRQGLFTYKIIYTAATDRIWVECREN